MASDESLCKAGGLPAWSALLSERRDKWAGKEGLLGHLPGAVKKTLGSTDAAGLFFVYKKMKNEKK